MRPLAIPALVSTLLLAGCYESTHELFPISGGDDIPIGRRVTCHNPLPGFPPDAYETSRTEKGGKVQFVFRRKHSDGTTFDSSVSFHKVDDRTWIAARRSVTGLKGRPYMYYFVRALEGGKYAILTYDKSIEQRALKANKVRVKHPDDVDQDFGIDPKLSGAAAGQRQAMIALAVSEPSKNKGWTCTSE